MAYSEGSGGRRLIEHLYRRLYAEKKFFEQYRPAEYRRLETLLTDPHPGVRLLSGDYHAFSVEELERLWSRVPWFLRGFIKLPLLFVYKRIGYYGVYRLVGPDVWAARLLGFLLYDDFTREVWEVRGSEMSRLLSEYKSLIIISLDLSL